MSIKILKPGLFSTIQDIGRLGYQDLGFSEAGALDYYSLSICLLYTSDAADEAYDV